MRLNAIQGDITSAKCPTRDVMDHVTSRWGMLVLIVLLDGTHRFSELRQRIGGVSEKMLAQSLRLLEEDGFVDRRAFAVVPPKVEYSLTPMGREVALRIHALGSWINANVDRVLSERTKRTRKRVRQRTQDVD